MHFDSISSMATCRLYTEVTCFMFNTQNRVICDFRLVKYGVSIVVQSLAMRCSQRVSSLPVESNTDQVPKTSNLLVACSQSWITQQFFIPPFIIGQSTLGCEWPVESNDSSLVWSSTSTLWLSLITTCEIDHDPAGFDFRLFTQRRWSL